MSTVSAVAQFPDLLAPVQRLDLSMIRMKLEDHAEGLGWPASHVDQVEHEYRKYLALCLEYPGRAIVPSREIDKFWHYHILDTQAYAADCAELFGYFLHHFPYFGMRGEDDAAALVCAYQDTLDLYQRHFGPPPLELWPPTGMARCPNCGRS